MKLDVLLHLELYDALVVVDHLLCCCCKSSPVVKHVTQVEKKFRIGLCCVLFVPKLEPSIEPKLLRFSAEEAKSSAGSRQRLFIGRRGASGSTGPHSSLPSIGGLTVYDRVLEKDESLSSSLSNNSMRQRCRNEDQEDSASIDGVERVG